MSEYHINASSLPPPPGTVVTFSAETSGAAPKFAPDGTGNFNFSGTTAGGYGSNGAIVFSAGVGELNGQVQVDNTTVIINASNQLEAVSGFKWSVIAINTAAVKGNGYFTNAPVGPAGLTVTLPAVCAVGDTIRVYDLNGNGWVVAVSAGQFIQIGVNATTPTVGTVTTNIVIGNSIELVCSVANTQWEAVDWNGNFLIT